MDAHCEPAVRLGLRQEVEPVCHILAGHIVIGNICDELLIFKNLQVTEKPRFSVPLKKSGPAMWGPFPDLAHWPQLGRAALLRVVV